MGITLAGNLTGVNKYGVNLDVDAAEDIWSGGGNYAFPTAARIHAIVSSDADDTDADTGAWTIQVSGLDADFEEQSEIVTLDGVNPVNTVGSYTRLHRMKVLTAGSSGTNEGTITATAAVDGTVTARIEGGDGQTMMAIWTSPNSCMALLESIVCTVMQTGPAGNVKMALYVRDATDADAAWRIIFRQGMSASSPIARVFHTIMPEFAGAHDFRLRAEAVSVVNMQLTGEFDIVLKPLYR